MPKKGSRVNNKKDVCSTDLLKTATDEAAKILKTFSDGKVYMSGEQPDMGYTERAVEGVRCKVDECTTRNGDKKYSVTINCTLRVKINERNIKWIDSTIKDKIIKAYEKQYGIEKKLIEFEINIHKEEFSLEKCKVELLVPTLFPASEVRDRPDYVKKLL